MSEAKTGRNEPTINSDSTNSCLTWTHHKHQQWKIVSVGNRGADENQTYVDMNSLQTNRSDAIALGPGNSVTRCRASRDGHVASYAVVHVYTARFLRSFAHEQLQKSQPSLCRTTGSELRNATNSPKRHSW